MECIEPYSLRLRLSRVWHREVTSGTPRPCPRSSSSDGPRGFSGNVTLWLGRHDRWLHWLLWLRHVLHNQEKIWHQTCNDELNELGLKWSEITCNDEYNELGLKWLLNDDKSRWSMQQICKLNSNFSIVLNDIVSYWMILYRIVWSKLLKNKFWKLNSWRQN